MFDVGVHYYQSRLIFITGIPSLVLALILELGGRLIKSEDAALLLSVANCTIKQATRIYESYHGRFKENLNCIVEVPPTKNLKRRIYVDVIDPDSSSCNADAVLLIY